MILFHSESSHLPTWPAAQFFFCIQPAQEQGETPLLDNRRIIAELDPEIVREFERRVSFTSATSRGDRCLVAGLLQDRGSR